MQEEGSTAGHRGEAVKLRPTVGLSPPALVGNLIVRPRLLAALAQAASSRLVRIAAPAGSGKTTLAALWHECLRADGNAVAWVTLDPADNEAVRWATRVAAAVERAVPEPATSLGAVTGAALVDPESVVAVLLGELAQFGTETFLFLDDLHVISDPGVIAILDRLLRHAPRSLHLVVMTRGGPQLAFAALRAGGGMFELDATALRFDLDEIDRLVTSIQGCPARPEDIRRLRESTDGWAIGLRILANSARYSAASARPVLSAPSPVLAEYLSEMLAGLPAALGEFLVTTSFLDRLTGPLCDAVTGGEDGAALLETIGGQHMLLTRLDEEGRWYCHHQLLAEHLRGRLRARPPEELQGLHRRACWWFAARSMWPDAVRHAIAAGDVAEARLWIEKCASGLVRRGDLLPLLAWHGALPPELLRQEAHVELAIAQALALAMRFDEAGAILNRVESSPEASMRDDIARGCAVLRGVLAGLGD